MINPSTLLAGVIVRQIIEAGVKDVVISVAGVMVLGVSWFAHKIHAAPHESGTPTVVW